MHHTALSAFRSTIVWQCICGASNPKRNELWATVKIQAVAEQLLNDLKVRSHANNHLCPRRFQMACRAEGLGGPSRMRHQWALRLPVLSTGTMPCSTFKEVDSEGGLRDIDPRGGLPAQA